MYNLSIRRCGLKSDILGKILVDGKERYQFTNTSWIDFVIYKNEEPFVQTREVIGCCNADDFPWVHSSGELKGLLYCRFSSKRNNALVASSPWRLSGANEPRDTNCKMIMSSERANYM